jgi:hypothetical protein
MVWYRVHASFTRYLPRFSKILFLNADACLFHANIGGRLLSILHVDDCYVVGSDEGLQYTETSLEKMV